MEAAGNPRKRRRGGATSSTDTSLNLATAMRPRAPDGYTPAKRELYPAPHPLRVIDEGDEVPVDRLYVNDESPSGAMSEPPSKLGGILRVLPEDFIVEEVLETRVCDISPPLSPHGDELGNEALREPKEYLHFTLVKKNWDTIRALNYVRRKVGVSLKRFGFSGMKDKRAVTAQRVSLWHGRADVLARLKLHEILLKEFEYADERINLGTAVGNRFTITIRDIPQSQKDIADIVTRFARDVTFRGVPNYFGPQRLGGGNAEVGRAIKDGDLRRGVDVILAKVRPYLADGGIEGVPQVFWYEKRMLRHLEAYPNDAAGALRKIPKKILRLYVHAYQSHLFNEQLQHALHDHQVPDALTIPGFTTPTMPELQTTSITRRTFLTAQDFTLVDVKEGVAVLRFTLGKGEYASTLLANLC
jgi:tRNA(Glu) U13 pseudouridine synthase TruD